MLSVIIPTYGRPGPLAVCLDSLARLDYPREHFEVLVVNDGGESPDGAVAAVRDRLDVTLLTQPHVGVARARNTGAAHARGRFLVFTDDDCVVTPGWLRALAARFAAAPERAVGGRTLNGRPDNLYSTASQLLVHYLYGYYNADRDQARFFAGNNFAVPAAPFQAIGGFDPVFYRVPGDDREFCDRWLYRGHRMSYAPEAVVYHTQSLSRRTFWRQHFNYGRGAFYFRQARARRGQEPAQVEPARFYLDLLRYPLGRAPGRQVLPLASLLMASQLANAVGFAAERAQQAGERSGRQQDASRLPRRSHG
jgi:GT2 family glycosyltransferase